VGRKLLILQAQLASSEYYEKYQMKMFEHKYTTVTISGEEKKWEQTKWTQPLWKAAVVLTLWQRGSMVSCGLDELTAAVLAS
jgi:hypothetical protein